MEVKLKKNGWHKKLQVWTFGNKAPEFNSLCPYFWTTVFCILVSPFVASFKYLIKLPLQFLALAFDEALNKIGNIITVLDEYFAVKVCQPLYEQKVSNYVETMSDEDALDIYENLYEVYDYRGKIKVSDEPYLKDKWLSRNRDKTYTLYKDKLDRWKKKVGDDWQDKLQALATAREARRKEEKKLLLQWQKEQEAKKERLKKTFNIIAYYTKYLVYLAIGVVGVYALYFLSLAGLLLYEARENIYNGLLSFGNFLIKVVVIGGPYVLAAIVGLALLIPTFILLGRLLVKCNLFQVKRNTKPSKLYLLTKKCVDGVAAVFDFFIMYFKAAKQNYCPRIDWE